MQVPADTAGAAPAPTLPLPPLWRQPEYMRLWTAQVIGNLGGHASGIAYPLLVLALTGSPKAASVVSVLHILPYLLLCLPVGALVDRWNRRRVMLACHAGRMLAVAVLVAASARGGLSLPLLYAVAVVEGVCMVFFNIAETAALPRVVPTLQLARATAQNQAGFGVSAVLGPALGAWLFEAGGHAAPFVLDLACHAVAALQLWRLRTSFVPPPAIGRRHLGAEVMEGLRWLWRERLVRDIALITGVVNMVQAAVPLLLIVLARQQGASESQVGVVFSCGGAGAILGALVGPWVQQRLPFGPALIGVLVIEAAAFPLFALGQGAWSLGLVYGVIMFVGPIYNVLQFSRRIAMIPDGLQGRVNSSFRLVAMGLNPVGAAACGWLLEHGGSGRTMAVFGMVWAAVALVAWADPVLRQARQRGG